MRAYFGRRYMISASHRLHTDRLNAEENRAAFGKCNNPMGHGHNYFIEVVLGGEVDPATGMVMNLADVDRIVRTTVLQRFDHANLNVDPLFAGLVPTTENFCQAIFDLLRPRFAPGSLDVVRVEETENNFFECREEGEKGD